MKTCWQEMMYHIDSLFITNSNPSFHFNRIFTHRWEIVGQKLIVIRIKWVYNEQKLKDYEMLRRDEKYLKEKCFNI